MYLSLLLAAAASLFPTPPAYQAVVVDAATHRPLAGVFIEEARSGTSQVSDPSGHVQFAAPGPLHLRLRSTGYAPVEVERPVLVGRVDTLALAPTATALEEVVVRPRQAITLSPFAERPHQDGSYFLIPSVQVAVFIPGRPAGPAQLSQLQLQLKPSTIRTGGLRVYLRGVAAEAGPTGPALLPVPLVVSAQQLATAPKGLLTLDLTSYNLDLPAEGLYVQLEALGSTPEQRYVAMTSYVNGRAPLVVTGADPADPHTYTTTRLDEYPKLALGESNDPARTWTLGSNGRGWRLVQPKPGTREKTRNSLVSLTVLATKD